MKLPQPAPDWKKLLKDAPKDKLVQAFARPEGQGALRRASGERYPYWDDFKYLPKPDDIPIEWVWLMREMSSIAHRNFVPFKDLNGSFYSYWLPDKAQEHLHYIDQRSTGPVLSDGKPLHSRERYIARSLTEEAIASSQLEGAATTRDAARLMLRTGRKPTNKSERMIANNLRAIERIRELKEQPLSREMLLELQSILTEGTLEPTDVGRFRKSPDDDNIVVEDADGIVLHRPPNGKELEARIDSLIEFANAKDEAPFIHPVIKAILLHFWVGYIHPFPDGNGRTARALFYWYVLKRDYWLFEFLSISQIVHRSYGQYKRAFLYSELDGKDATYFIMYNLRVIRLALNELLKYIERKGAELQRANELVRRLPELNHRQRELLLHAVKNPGHSYSIYSHQSIHKVSYQTARTDLLQLATRGYLEQHKSGQTYLFLPTPSIGKELGIGI